MGSVEMWTADLALLEQEGSLVKLQALDDSSVLLLGGRANR